MNGPHPDMSLPVEGRDDVRYVAWHGGGAITLQIGLRHVAPTDAIQGRQMRWTLCGRTWRRSREVTPNDYWTKGDCKICFAKLATLEAEAEREREVREYRRIHGHFPGEGWPRQ
jgi:hypothetical protein